jgi:hypothetical protein
MRRKPQPGLGREAFATFAKGTIEHQKFTAGRQIEHNRSVWLPALHPHLLTAVVE